VIDATRDFATLQAFIVGRLSDEERLAFEDRLACEPTLVRELEQSLRMREGLRQLRTRGYFSSAAAQRKRWPVWLPVLAAAASAVLALFLWVSRTAAPAPLLTASLEARAVAGATSLVAAHFTFVSMRGSSAPDLELPSSGLIEIRAEPSASGPGQRYRMVLARESEGAGEQPVAVLNGLTVSPDGYLHAYADAGRLRAGAYDLHIQADNGVRSETATFPFNLRPVATDPSR
jgi:hypothetical protein